MQFEVDGLPPGRLHCPVNRRQFGAAKVLVDHREFGVEVDKRQLPKAKAFRFSAKTVCHEIGFPTARSDESNFLRPSDVRTSGDIAGHCKTP
jgi:hypothetical protein